MPARRRRTRPGSLKARAPAAAEVAAKFADAVDREGRFPKEAFDAIREQKLLGLLIPAALGGEDASAAEVVDVCYILGRACASSAMIYAMHQVKIACLVRHAGGNRLAGRPAAPDRRRAIADGVLDDRRRQWRQYPLQRSGDPDQGCRASPSSATPPSSPTAQHADGIVTTARRNEAAASSDQVLVAFLKEDYTLERTQSWDTLGMRGTCSAGFILRAQGEPQPGPARTL